MVTLLLQVVRLNQTRSYRRAQFYTAPYAPATGKSASRKGTCLSSAWFRPLGKT